MYCVVKYSVIEKKETELMEKTSRDTAPVVDSKVSVERSYSQKSVEKTEMMRYDDEVKEILINPNCLTRILLDYVCEQLTIDKEAEIDFCDEYGRLAKINNLKNWEYATEALKPQLTYAVIVFQRGKGGKYKSIRPVLTKHCKLYADIIFHLRSQFSSSSIYISDKSSSRSFQKARGSRPSLSDDRYYSASGSKTSDARSKMYKGSEASMGQFGKKSTSKSTLDKKSSKRQATRSAQAALGADSEVEIKTKGSRSIMSRTSQSRKKDAA